MKATAELGRVLELADLSAGRADPARLRWTWGDALYLWSLTELDAFLGEERYLGLCRGYCDRFAKLRPAIDQSDTCAPGLVAHAVWKRTGDPGALSLVEDVERYMLTEPRVVGDAPNHLGHSLEGRFYPSSVWVDSLMMFGLFALRRGGDEGEEALFELGARQPRLYASLLQDPGTGLFRHSWWVRRAGPQPRGPVFWGRGNGWVMASLPMILGSLPADHPEAATIEGILRRLAEALLPLQRPDGFWTTLLEPESRSYRESSATALIAAGFLRASRGGWLDPRYAEAGLRAYDALVDSLGEPDSPPAMGGISLPTIPLHVLPRLGYLAVPRGRDVSYGLAALFLAAIEAEKTRAGRISSVYNTRDFSLHIGTPAPAGYPASGPDDPFVEEAPAWSGAADYAAAFELRRSAFLAFCRASPAPANLKAPFFELPRALAGLPVHEGVLDAGLDYIEARRDCADFIAHAYIRLLLTPRLAAGVAPRLLERARAVLLGFKYWPGEPGIDSLCTWTENHQILYASAAFILGRAWPDEVFTNSGMKGRELAASALPRIRRWLELRFRSGFSEWLSNVYYDEDLTALLSLVDFAAAGAVGDAAPGGAATDGAGHGDTAASAGSRDNPGPEVAARAGAVADLLILDLALHSCRGVFGPSHGRSYETQKKDARLEAMSDTMKLAFGFGRWARNDNMSSVALALGSYRLPPAIAAIASPEALEGSRVAAAAGGALTGSVLTGGALTGCAEIRSRMGIRIDEAERWGLGFRDSEDGMVFLGLEAYNNRRTINLTFRLFDEFRWWENSYFLPFRRHRGIIRAARRLGLLPLVARALERDIDRNAREEVDLYTFRTADYSLSAAQDWHYRRGGDQQALWQATLGPGAVSFTTHPGCKGGFSPGYWTGSGSLPRVAQHRNLLFALYDIDTRPGLYRTERLLYSHAWLPEEEFDEIAEEGGWIFARKGRAYLALRADRPLAWRREDGGPGPRNEVIAEGRQSAWICRLGREAEDGSFAAFRSSLAGARLSFGAPGAAKGGDAEDAVADTGAGKAAWASPGGRISFEDPALGLVEFGPAGPLVVAGREVALHGYPRYDSPWAKAPFPAETVEIDCLGERLTLTKEGRR
jgi:unsaturated rhamnogalacturonyl hydrolase